MTHIITTVTEESILMASDTRLNYHKIEKNKATWETYQVILAIADCIRKTFYIETLNIWIQFIGIWYFKKNDNRYPLSEFIGEIKKWVQERDSIQEKFIKVFENLKLLTSAWNVWEYVNWVMTWYESSTPYICTFNTFDTNIEITSCLPGAYVESKKNNINIPQNRLQAINYINRRINNLSIERPQDIWGPIEILEIFPDWKIKWIQENKNIFNWSQENLIENWNNNIELINGKILNPPIKQKLEV